MAKVKLRCGGVTLAVEVEHLRRRVTLPGNGIRGHRGLDAGQVLGGETDTQRAEAFRKPFACAGADQRDDVGAPREHPGDGELCRGDRSLGRGSRERVGKGEILH